jgi:RNA-dependent RNA polymerase
MATSHKDLFSLIVRPFIICGGVFRAFYAKENNVFFVKTNEDLKRMPQTNPSIKDAMSFISFLNFHNPLEENCNQVSLISLSAYALMH